MGREGRIMAGAGVVTAMKFALWYEARCGGERTLATLGKGKLERSPPGKKKAKNEQTGKAKGKKAAAEPAELAPPPKGLRFVDIGSNLTDPMFAGVYRDKLKHENDLQAVLERSFEVGLERIMVTAGCLEDIKEAKVICEIDPKRLHTTVGVHPTRCNEFEASGNAEGYLKQLDEHIESAGGKVVAIGECGLDYDRLEFCPVETQKKYFEWHFGLAEKYKLPMFLHNRNTGGDFAAMIRANRHRFRHGVVHSFDGPMEEMKELVAMDLFIGINGCSLKTEENLKVMAEIPLDHLMIETDAPWCDIRLTHASHQYVKSKFAVANKPEKWEPGKGVKGRNEPNTIVQVLEVICGYRGLELEAVSRQVFSNTMQVFFSHI